MFNKKVIITDYTLRVGNNNIKWENIVGIKEYNNMILQKLSYRFPRSELFLRGGKTISISIQNSFYNKDKKKDYESSLQAIIENTYNLNKEFENWIEWRLLLPPAIFEILAIIIFFSFCESIINLIKVMLSAGIGGVLIGWIWEKKSRKNLEHKLIAYKKSK